MWDVIITDGHFGTWSMLPALPLIPAATVPGKLQSHIWSFDKIILSVLLFTGHCPASLLTETLNYFDDITVLLRMMSSSHLLTQRSKKKIRNAVRSVLAGMCNCQQMITILRNCDDTESKILKPKLSNLQGAQGDRYKAKAAAQSKLATG